MYFTTPKLHFSNFTLQKYCFLFIYANNSTKKCRRPAFLLLLAPFSWAKAGDLSERSDESLARGEAKPVRAVVATMVFPLFRKRESP